MTKPEGYEGHYADIASERDGEQEKMRDAFEAQYRQPPHEWTLEQFTAACASKEREMTVRKHTTIMQPEGYYADIATERDAEQEKMLEEFQVWFRTVKHCVGDRKMQLEIFCHGYKVACARKQAELNNLLAVNTALRESNADMLRHFKESKEELENWKIVAENWLANEAEEHIDGSDVCNETDNVFLVELAKVLRHRAAGLCVIK